MHEYICDMSFIRHFHDSFLESKTDAKLIVTYYNVLDLMASPANNFGNLNNRLDKRFRSVLSRMLNHHMIYHEPFFDILQESFPSREIEYSNGLDIRSSGASGEFSFLLHINENGSNISEDDKLKIIEFANQSQFKKQIQIEKTESIRNEIKSKLIKQNLNAKDYRNWIPFVEMFLIRMIQDYANDPKFLQKPFLPNLFDIDTSSCELFINSFSYYLMDNSKKRDINDNIDALTLLYVRNVGEKVRKLLIRDKTWENCIKMVGLKEKYLEPLDIYKTNA